MASTALHQKQHHGVLLVLPGLLISSVLIVFPVLSITYLSVSGEDGRGFVGLSNFYTVFRTTDFSLVLPNTIKWTAGTVITALLLGFGGALLLNKKYVRGKGVFQALFLLPWIVPQVVVATLWKWLYSTDFGLINRALVQFGLIDAPVAWLINPGIVLPALGIVQVWATAPFVMLMIFAALQSIPESMLEAARLDGANRWQELWHIVIPHISNVLFIVLLIIVVWALNSFTIIWVITQGGPAGSSSVFSTYIYQALQSFDVQTAAVVALIQFVASLIFAMIYIFQIQKNA